MKELTHNAFFEDADDDAKPKRVIKGEDVFMNFM